MPRLVTKSELITRAQQRSDLETSGGDSIVSIEEWRDLADEAVAELYDHLVDAFGPARYSRTGNINTVAGTSDYDLATDFYRLVAPPICHTAGTGSGVVNLRPFQPEAWARLVEEGTATPRVYQLHGAQHTLGAPAQIRLLPIPDKAYLVQVMYLPVCAGYWHGAEQPDEYTYDGIDGWEEIAVLWMAIRAVAKEERDTSLLERERDRMIARIQRQAGQVDLAQPQQIVDVSPRRRAGARSLRGHPWEGDW